MIFTQDPNHKLHDYLIDKLACPICLSDLSFSIIDNKNDRLTCTNCKANYHVSDGFPVLLIKDANWAKKDDEIKGEVNYNAKKIPLEVHLERNDYINRNTEMFFRDSEVDISNSEILIVGCAQMELEYFINKCKNAVALDIVPSMAKGCSLITKEKKLPAAWLCGDGEGLPFLDESFDAAIVRQSLHHMLKYYSSISEFFRVCKKGGHVLIIDEPFVKPNLLSPPLSSLPNDFHFYKSIELKHIRERMDAQFEQNKIKKIQKSKSLFSNVIERFNRKFLKVIDKSAVSQEKTISFIELEKERTYIEPDITDPETFLADKYYSFSLLQCIHAISLHTKDFKLLWLPKIARTDESGDIVKFFSTLR